ncbi:MAG: DUF2442 domain-containing protein [Pseudomonadota bacterium]
MLKLIDAKPLAPYRLHLQFSDGRSGMADLHELISAPAPHAFVALKTQQAFEQCGIEDGALHWSSELDLAPEYLYFLTFKDDVSLREQFKSWGYLA